jgi:putative transposase
LNVTRDGGFRADAPRQADQWKSYSLIRDAVEKEEGMQGKKRRDAVLKIAVALDALKGGKTLKDIAANHGVHPVQVSAWKKILRESLERIFSGRAQAPNSPSPEDKAGELRPRAESLRAEHRWMRDKLAGLDLEVRQSLIEPSESSISLRNQCKLLKITRSSLYYRKKPERMENLRLMAKIRELAEQFPQFGVLRMTKALRDAGQVVNPKRVRRLMRKLAPCLAFLQYLSLSPWLHHFHRVARFH